MILLCGIPSEPPLALVIGAAERLGIAHVVFNQRHAQFCDVMLDLRDGTASGVLRAWECDWPMKQFTGVYTRLTETASLPENKPRGPLQPDPALVAKSHFIHDTLNAWLELADCRVVNKNSAVSSNASKPYQAQFIRECGFQIPPTLVTNEPDKVREFARLHGRLIYKSISSVRSIVREFLPQSQNDLEKIRCLPAQFQARIRGADVRVHVVGDAIFATEIESDAVDYRYAHQDGLEVAMHAVTLPETVAVRCRWLSQLLALPFCGIDLKRTPEGDYYCFEVNPSPAYSYYEEQTAQPIAQALVQFLAGAQPTTREPRASHRKLGRDQG